MDVKTLVTHPERCNNCGDCETVCVKRHSSLTSPELSCIKILCMSEKDDFFFPIACKQCENPPCLAICPKEAIYRDDQINRVLIDRTRCVGCSMCVTACPFGAVKVDKRKAKSYKCDLCNGDPECVKVCEPFAIEYKDTAQIPFPNMRRIAGKLAKLFKL